MAYDPATKTVGGVTAVIELFLGFIRNWSDQHDQKIEPQGGRKTSMVFNSA